MNSPQSNPDSSQIASLSRDRAHQLTERLIDNWGDALFSAHAVLDQYPQLRDYPSCIVDLAYEEFCRTRESGQTVAASKFVKAFSTVEQSLFRVIEFDQVLRDHPSLVEEIPEERWPLAGDEFLDFLLCEQIGRGALSRVFLARHNKLGMKLVVVKVCIRGEREADLLGKLEHANVGEVHSIDIDKATGLAAICMPFQTRFTMHNVAEWIAGSERNTVSARPKASAIASYIREVTSLPDGSGTSQSKIAAPFLEDDSLDQVIVKWGVQLADAMTKAHSNGVLHCDVKPGNVLVLPDLSSRLLDFNLATSDVDPLRLAGGTLPYMAPEQLQFIRGSDSEVSPDQADDADDQMMDNRTDIFGLCATIWHMATGSPPFGCVADHGTRREAVDEMLRRIEAGVPRQEQEKAGQVLSPAVLCTLLKGMSYEKTGRHESMAELSADFGAAIRKPPQTRKFLTVLGIVTLSILAAAFSYYIADPVPAAMNKARQLLKEGDAKGAEEVLAGLQFANDECRIMALVAKTSQIPNLDYEMLLGQEKGEIFAQWEQSLAEWDNLAKRSGYPEVCLFNAYLVQLEMLSDITPAFGWLDSAFQIRADDKFEPRRMLMRRIYAKQRDKSFDNAEAIHKLTETMKDGTRGEFICLIRMAYLELHRNPTEMTNADLDQMLLNLSSDEALAEPYLVRYWRGRNSELSKIVPISKELQGTADALAPKSNPRTLNNLIQHLRLPAEKD